ncbi:MAG: ATP phosphoribosyltransferase [Bacteroidetes bacterium]|jgi:ATP phosphoribosyltransferase|nr:ATP phosphoribosyltransferase [Bacteroidota bacterium]MDA1019208.1 ATP phosphoribosyltransferase [Bacteroidota bacterium]|tara:strand:- start:41876 stop:42733 length:858 start_codon:yes stop_codon:yes gene_type:complete
MNRIKIAIQKSGRLNEDSLNLLKKCGINIDNYKDQLKASSNNFPIDVFFLKNSDIPQYINDGVVDLAIIGENLIIENNNEIDIVERLGFSKCKVSIAVPNEMEYKSVKDLNNLKIASSYPNTLKCFLNKESIKAEIHVINGSVEIAPNIGLSEAICDIVSSGSTLYKNNLKEVHVIHYSEAVLAVSSTIDIVKLKLLEKLLFRIRAVLKAKKSKYILLNAPNDRINIISEILPVLKSPTVLPLKKEGWSSLHSVIEEDTFWEVIDKIKEAGAEDILVCPIEKMVL